MPGLPSPHTRLILPLQSILYTQTSHSLQVMPPPPLAGVLRPQHTVLVAEEAQTLLHLPCPPLTPYHPDGCLPGCSQWACCPLLLGSLEHTQSKRTKTWPVCAWLLSIQDSVLKATSSKGFQ